MSGLSGFKSVQLAGAVIPADAITRAADGAMPGQKPADYGLVGSLTINAAAARAWDVLLPAHQAWKVGLVRAAGTASTGQTRDRWLLPLLYELGYGRPTPLQAGVDLPPGLGETRPSHFTLSHQLSWPPDADTPSSALAIHLLGPEIDLEHKTPGVTARAPHAMVQELLNRSPEHLWALISNGSVIRVLRDVSSLARQSYLEFDLDLIFDNQFYADFRLLFTVLHASRLTPRADESAGEHVTPRPENCWLEEWRTTAITDGARALDALREGVATAITSLGTGFLVHPENIAVTSALAENPGAEEDLHRWLLRAVYGLIVLFVAEDRDLLHPLDCDQAARELYEKHFSSVRLRDLAASRSGSRHSDLWDAHRIITGALGGDGNETLALPGLAASLYEPDQIGLLRDARISNRHVLAAVRALSQVRDKQSGASRPVDYRNLDSEELGGVYEGLLAYIPKYDPDARTFTLTPAPGSERKTSGSFYTGSVLISLLLDETLDPLIDEALRSPDPEAALLGLTVCDPACGSGHFLVAAARRIAKALAAVRVEDLEPSPDQVRAALRDVVTKCIYGVDRNDLAIEIAKVALWLETLERGKPLAFLDGHLKVGDALLGTTPALLRRNLPDAAISVLLGDDKSWTSTLRQRNKLQRTTGQLDLFASSDLNVRSPNVLMQALTLESATTAAETIEDVRARADAWRRLERDPDLVNAKFLADTWCAAFVQPKTVDAAGNKVNGPGITYETLSKLQGDPSDIDQRTKEMVNSLARTYRFFHWHLEFPGVFHPPADGGTTTDRGEWSGGFSCILGNPPWDTLSPDTREFFGELVPDIRRLSKAEKDSRIEQLLQDETYQRKWDTHQRKLFATVHFLKSSGRYTMYAEGNLGKGDFNIYRSFAELALTFTRAGGYAGQILQSGIYAGANASAIRKHLLDDCTWTAVYGFNNKGGTWFPGVTLENFGAYAACVATRPSANHEIRAAFGLHHPETLGAELAASALTFAPDDIRLQNPESYAIPDIRDPRGARLSRRLYRTWDAFGKPLGDLPLRDFSREIDMSDRNGVFGEGPSGLPVYEGRMIDFYDHRAKRYVSGHGNSSVWDETPFGSPRKQIVAQWYVQRNDLQNNDVRARTERFRVGFMDVADPGRQRSFVSAIIPPGVVCGDKVPTIRFDDEWYMPIYLSVANSIIVDFLARQRVLSKKMALNILDSLPIARLRIDDPRSQWLAVKGLRLSCTSFDMIPLWNSMAELGWVDACDPGNLPGETDPQRRRALRAAIDAFVAREVYELPRADLEIVLDSFVQLEVIEAKAHGEFLTRRLVLEAFDRRDWWPLPTSPRPTVCRTR
jgi:N-6 DNA Methylase